jgi:sec-independent protein translocase protein TatA
MLGSLGMPELLIIAVVALLIFGPKRLPQMGRAVGDTIREFRNVGKEIEKGHEGD